MPGDRGLTAQPHEGWTVRVGGRWAVSWQGWLVTAPLGVLTYPMVEPGATGPADALRWVVVAMAGWLALGAVAWLAGRTVLRDRVHRPVPWLLVLAVGAIAGAARGVVVGLLAQAWGVDGGVPVSSRVLAGALIGALWILVTALMASAIADYRARRRELVDRALDVHRDRLLQQRQARELEDELLAALREQLAQVRAGLPDPAASGTMSAPDVARAIRQSAQEAIRPISHRWDVSPEGPVLPALRAREILDQVASADRLRAWPVLVVLAAINGPLLAREFGMVVAVGTLACFAGLLAGSTAALRSGQPASRRRFVAWMAAGAGCAVLTAPVMLAMGMPADLVSRWVAAAMVCVPIMQIATGLAFAASPLRELSLERLEDFVDRQQLERWAAERELAQMRGRVARFLHGRVQSRLLAAALVADSGVPTDDVAGGGDDPTAHALVRAREALSTDVTAALREAERVPVADLERIASAWRGLVAVSVDAELDAELVPRDAVTIVEEAIADAVRHGGAEVVSVHVRADADGIWVSVEDDGTPSEGSAGLGSALLDRCSGGHWSRGPSPSGGTVLRARVAVPGRP